MIRYILIANALLLLSMIGYRVFIGPFVIKQFRCPSIEIMERPGPQPDLFHRNPPKGVEI